MKNNSKTKRGGDPTSECALDIPGNTCIKKNMIGIIKETIKQGEGNSKPVHLITEEEEQEVLKDAKEKTGCNSTRCVLNNMKKMHTNYEVEKTIEENLDRLKPEGPANSTALLNNSNIDETLRRLSKVHDGFYHMDFQMIDFAGVKDYNGKWKISKGIPIDPTELGTIDIVDDVIEKGYKTFAVVLNTDKRTGGGIHWFCLFCDFRTTGTNPITIEYFNSSGNYPVKEVDDWLVKTNTRINQTRKYKSKIVRLTGMVHQKDSKTECGLYSIYYIWKRLNNTPCSMFQAKRVPDSKMIAFRKDVFNSA